MFDKLLDIWWNFADKDFRFVIIILKVYFFDKVLGEIPSQINLVKVFCSTLKVKWQKTGHDVNLKNKILI